MSHDERWTVSYEPQNDLHRIRWWLHVTWFYSTGVEWLHEHFYAFSVPGWPQVLCSRADAVALPIPTKAAEARAFPTQANPPAVTSSAVV